MKDESAKKRRFQGHGQRMPHGTPQPAARNKSKFMARTEAESIALYALLQGNYGVVLSCPLTTARVILRNFERFYYIFLLALRKVVRKVIFLNQEEREQDSDQRNKAVPDSSHTVDQALRVLGLDPSNWTMAQARKHYRKKALRYHPDKNIGKNEEEAAFRMAELNRAIQDLESSMTGTVEVSDDEVSEPHQKTSSFAKNQNQQKQKAQCRREKKERESYQHETPKSSFEKYQQSTHSYRKHPMDLCTHPVVLALAVGADDNFVLHSLIRGLREQQYKQITLTEALIAELDAQGNTLLHYAVYYNSEIAVHLVLRLAARDWIQIVLTKNCLGQRPSDISPKEHTQAKDRLALLQAQALEHLQQRNTHSFDSFLWTALLIDLCSAFCLVDALFLRTFSALLHPKYKIYITRFGLFPALSGYTYLFYSQSASTATSFFWTAQVYLTFWPFLCSRSLLLCIPALFYSCWMARLLERGSRGSDTKIKKDLKSNMLNNSFSSSFCLDLYRWLQVSSAFVSTALSLPLSYILAEFASENVLSSASSVLPQQLDILVRHNKQALLRFLHLLVIDLCIILFLRWSCWLSSAAFSTQLSSLLI